MFVLAALNVAVAGVVVFVVSPERCDVGWAVNCAEAVAVLVVLALFVALAVAINVATDV